MTDLLMELVLTGHDVNAVPVDGGWLEIDTVRDFEAANAMVDDSTITRFYNPSATA
jgi:NDP-sugar pyrophosphorylase family protein